LDVDVDNEEEKEEDRAVDDPDPREGGGEGIAIRTATLIVVGKEDLRSVIDIFLESVPLGLVALSTEADEAGRGEVGEGVGLKNLLARVKKEGVVETSGGRWFSSSPLGVEGVREIMGGGIGIGTGGERIRLAAEPE